MVQWDRHIENVLAILKRHARIVDALPEISALVGIAVTSDALKHALRARKLGPPRNWLATAGWSSDDSSSRDSGDETSALPREGRRFVPGLDSEIPESWTSQAGLPAGKVATSNETGGYDSGDGSSIRQVDILDEHLGRKRETMLRSERQVLLERLAESEARNRFAERISAPHKIPPRITTREHASGLREGMAVALASDWHIEEIVRSESVADRNEYSLAIAQRRAERFFDGVSWLVKFNRGAWIVRDLCLWLGGDLMTGYIHPELEESNELSPVETIITLRGWLRRGIRQLLEDSQLERIVIPCNYGNHGRTGVKKRIKTGAENSFEWLLYHTLADDFAGEDRVSFEIPRSAHAYIEAFDQVLHFHHGDEVRYWGGVGGLHIPLGKRVPKWENVKRADLHHIGHFHTLSDVGHTVVNGSLIGYSEYAFSIGAEYERPQQAFYMLDSKRGKCNVTPIWVD